MKNAGDTLPRRAFLSGAASLLGAGALGAVPGLTPPVAVAGLSAYFWNGTKFVPIGEAPTQPVLQSTVQVRVQELMGSSTPVSIDAVLPGGVFHAYVGSPQGSGRSAFPAPYSSAGVSLAVTQGAAQQTLALGAKGALGFYLLVGATQPVGSLMLIEGATTTVIDSRGAPLGTPTILVQLS